MKNTKYKQVTLHCTFKIYKMILLKKIKSFFSNHTLRNLSISTVFILLTGTIVFHFVEGWRILDSLYFSVITLTTVGFGDFTPETDFGKIFTIIYVLSGIGIIFGFINTLFLHRDQRTEKIRQRVKERHGKQR